MGEFGDRIKELRLARGLTQEELGELTGLQKSAIAKYENGKTENMKRAVIMKMAKALGVSPAYLAFGEEAETEGYYYDRETADMAQEMFERPELRVLFDASRNATKEDIEAVAELLTKLSQK